MAFHVVFTSEFAINKTGRFDIFTEIYLRCFDRKNEFLLQLKADVVKAYETGEPVELPEDILPLSPRHLKTKASQTRTKEKKFRLRRQCQSRQLWQMLKSAISQKMKTCRHSRPAFS